MDNSDNFELTYLDETIKIERFTISDQTLYRVHFHGRPPLILTRAKDVNLGGFWTSVPEGKQKEAQIIGGLIENHFQPKL